MILKDAMLWRMIWKEYRAQRGYWLVIAGFSIVLMLLFLRFSGANDKEWFLAPWAIAFSLPAVYALGCAATIFATEREDGTLETLQIMAARTSRVFWGKVSFSLVSTLAMSLVLLAAALVVTWGTPIRVPPAEWDDILNQAHATLAMTVLFLAWGFLFSAIFRKALTAVCMTAAVPLAILGTTANTGFWRERSVVDIWLWGIAFVVPLVAGAYVLTGRAIAGRSREWSWPRFRVRSRSAVNPLDRLAAVKEASPTWRRTLQRFVWLEFRHVLSIGHVLWIATISAVVLWPMLVARGGGLFGIGGMVVIPLFMGVWAFQAEAGRRTRFLADHGLSPQVVWLTKQLVWGLTSIALALPFLIAVAIGNAHDPGTHGPTTSAYHYDVPGASATTYVLLLGCLAYGAGQFASMLIPRGLTAGFVAWVMFAAFAPWTWFMIALRVPVWFSVVPLVVVLLVATLGWSRNWLLERSTAKSWLRLALGLVSAITLEWAFVGVFRAYEVPRPEFVDAIAPFREAHGQPLSPEETETANLYRQITVNGVMGSTATEDQSLIHDDAGRSSAVNGWEQATDAQQRLLADNQAALQRVLAATARQRCAFNDPLRPISELSERAVTPQNSEILTTLILLSARELESQGKLDEALKRYVAVLRMARHVANRGTMREWSDAVAIERRVGTWVVRWVAHRDQTPDRIAAAAQRISQETAQFPSLRDAVLTQQFMIHRAVHDDWSQLLPRHQNPEAEAHSRTVLNVFDCIFPWERLRGLRLVDLVGAAELYCLDLLEQGLARPGFDMQHLASLADAVPTVATPKYWKMLNANQILSQDRLGMGDFFGPHPLVRMQSASVPWNWVNTTYPLNERLTQGILPVIWEAGLGREVSLRAMLLRLKLTTYKMAQGEYPELLDARILGKDAIDPYTGALFGYRREGFPFEIRATAAGTSAGETIPARQPMFWSAGPLNVRQIVPEMEVTTREGGDGKPIEVHAPGRIAETTAPIFVLP